MNDPRDVLLRPVVSEKSYALLDHGVYTFVVHPDRGGPHPVILFLMDAPSIREELRDMARRLATVGYYVVLPWKMWPCGEPIFSSMSGGASACMPMIPFEKPGA